MDLEQYAKKIFGFAMSKTNNVQDAEDLSQEILISLYNSSEKVNNVDNLDAYVYKICLYTWSNFYRKHKRHWRNVDIDLINDLRANDDIDDLLEKNEKMRMILLLRKEIAYMSKTYREILINIYFENKTIKEVSKEMDIAEGTIKWYIHDLKLKLRERTGKVSDMDRLQSFRPVRLKIGHCGSPGKNGEPNSYFNSLLYQNIAYAAYKEPLTLEEISRKLEVGCAFVEEALEVLVAADLIVRDGKKYQTAFFIADTAYYEELLDIFIKRAEKIALPMYEVLKGVLNNIKAVGFAGSDLEDDILMWTLYPYYVQVLLYNSKEYNSLKAVPPEHIDGGKYIALARVIDDKEENSCDTIYDRLSSEGIKERDRETAFSFQVDSYFEGAVWREFNVEDINKLLRISELVRNNLSPNEFEKIIISEYVVQGYLAVVDEKIKFKFPIMTRDEKCKVDEIVENAFRYVNVEGFFDGIVKACYEFNKNKFPKTISDNDLRVRSVGESEHILLACMEYLERTGKLRTPSEEEKKALTTLVWEK